jgi:hypothetical protein
MAQRRSTHKATKIDHTKRTATFTGYLVMSARGNLRLSRGQPSLDAGEVSLALNLTVPMQVFSRPSLKADIVLPDNIGEVDASADVVLDLKRALRVCPGVELKVGGKTVV